MNPFERGETPAILIDALKAKDDERPRTKQTMIGPSGLGGCARRTVLQINDAPKVNETSRISSIMGTAIHAAIEEALSSNALYKDFLEITVPGIEGLIADAHVDFYRPMLGRVVDWKTTKKANLRNFPYQSQRWQVHTYGYLMKQAGYHVESVELVAIPRDGTEKDIVSHVEEYDESVAVEGLQWLTERYNEAAVGYLPEPEKFPAFCRLYCPYYSPDPQVGCPGKVKNS